MRHSVKKIMLLGSLCTGVVIYYIYTKNIHVKCDLVKKTKPRQHKVNRCINDIIVTTQEIRPKKIITIPPKKTQVDEVCPKEPSILQFLSNAQDKNFDLGCFKNLTPLPDSTTSSQNEDPIILMAKQQL